MAIIVTKPEIATSSLRTCVNELLYSLSIDAQQEKWYEYFRQEIQVDKMFFCDDKGLRKKERYQYLLSRKHELGGVTVSLGIVCIVQLIVNIKTSTMHGWSICYLIVSFILFLIIAISRWYSSKNIDKYFEHYLKESSDPKYNN